MRFVEVGGLTALTLRQRWSNYLTIMLGVFSILVGINLRDTVIYASTIYTNLQAGIRAEYPRNWLIDEDGDYIFRVRESTTLGFKTTIQVTTRPVSPATSTRNVLDALSLARAQTLAAYRVFEEQPYSLPDEVPATAMTYTFVAAEVNPFLQSVPVVVLGIDIITIARGQAIIITFLSGADAYQQNLPIFERFLETLNF